jgi:hypothetical protein
MTSYFVGLNLKLKKKLRFKNINQWTLKVIIKLKKNQVPDYFFREKSSAL